MSGIETLGEAWRQSWRITAACALGRRPEKHVRECFWQAELDMLTLVATRGRDFPVARIAERLRCPRCGCRQVRVMIDPRNTFNAAAGTI